jgi:hypothetical protein
VEEGWLQIWVGPHKICAFLDSSRSSCHTPF